MKKTILSGYSLGSLGTGIFSSVPSVLLLYFMTDTLGVPAQLAALAIFIPKIWDMFTDPMMGAISDNTKSRWGRRRPFLLIGAILMPIFFVVLFAVPDFENPTHSFYYVLVAFILLATTYTIFAVPYMALPAEMSDDYHERTIIVSFRMTVVIIGILIGAAVGPYLVQDFGGGRQGYMSMAAIFGVICFVGMMASFFSTKYIPLKETPQVSHSLKNHISFIMDNKPFIHLLLSYFIQLVGVGAFTAMVPYFVIYGLGNDVGFISVMFLVLLGTAALTMSVWVKFSRIFGKRKSYVFSIVIYSLGLLSLYIPSEGAFSGMIYGQMFLLGLGFSGIQVLPFSMLTDVIHHDRTLCGFQREGILTGIWTAGEKVGLAFGPLIAGNILAFSGFIESSSGVIAVQPESAIQGIQIAVSVVPAVLVLSSLLLLRNYNLSLNTETVSPDFA